MPVRAMIFEGKDQKTGVTLAEAVAALSRAGAIVWIDCDEQTPELEQLLAGPLALHPLTIEDVWAERGVPKVEDFGRYVYLLAHALSARPAPHGDLHVARAEVDIVVGRNFVFTHHPPGLAAIDRARDGLLRRGLRSPWQVAHAVVDQLVDDELPMMDAFDDAIEALEAVAVARRPVRGTLPRILALRRQLHVLRRTSVHQREVLLKLARGDVTAIPEEALPFFRDVHDHFVRLADLIDDDRDLLGGVLEAHLNMVSIRLNEVMKILTLITTVLLPVSLVPAIYGMNFIDIPELKWAHGYAYAWALMLGLAGALLLWFRRRGWFD